MTSSPTIDGSGSVRSGGSSTSTSLTTTNSGDLIVAFTTSLGANVSVSSITGGGLSFSAVTPMISQNSSGTFNNMSVWTAVAASTVNATITVNMSGSVSNLSFAVFGVSGLFSTGAPYDPNVKTPLTTAANPITALVLTTSNPDDLLIYCGSGQAANANSGDPTGFSTVTGQGGTGFVDIVVSSMSVSTTQSSSSIITSSTPTAGTAMLLAFTANATASPTGTRDYKIRTMRIR